MAGAGESTAAVPAFDVEARRERNFVAAGLLDQFGAGWQSATFASTGVEPIGKVGVRHSVGLGPEPGRVEVFVAGSAGLKQVVGLLM